MAESGVIREFLVSLGFKIDRSGQEGIVNAVENTALKVLGGDVGRAGGATIDHRAEITIHGARDPSQTGHEVAGQQRRVNEDLARNLSSGVR